MGEDCEVAHHSVFSKKIPPKTYFNSILSFRYSQHRFESACSSSCLQFILLRSSVDCFECKEIERTWLVFYPDIKSISTFQFLPIYDSMFHATNSQASFCKYNRWKRENWNRFQALKFKERILREKLVLLTIVNDGCNFCWRFDM